MRKFKVYATVGVSVMTYVNAVNEKHAKQLAEARTLQGLCHQCAYGHPDEVWSLVGELDGEPEIKEVTVWSLVGELDGEPEIKEVTVIE